MKIPLIKPHLSEEEGQAVLEVIPSTWINKGKQFSAPVINVGDISYGEAFLPQA